MSIRFAFFYFVCYLFCCKLSVQVVSFFISSLVCTSIFQQKALLVIECNQEIEKIKKKYASLLEKEDSTYLQTQRYLDDVYRKVALHKSLAEKFRVEMTPSAAARGRYTKLTAAGISCCFPNNVLVITSLSTYGFACCDLFNAYFPNSPSFCLIDL